MPDFKMIIHVKNVKEEAFTEEFLNRYRNDIFLEFTDYASFRMYYMDLIEKIYGETPILNEEYNNPEWIPYADISFINETMPELIIGIHRR